MGKYVVVSLILLLSPMLGYLKAHSPLIDNGVWFYDRLVMKLDVNPLFHYQHANYDNGVCSSKMGPACSFLQPQLPLRKNPKLKEQGWKAQAVLLIVARRYAPILEKVTAEQSNLLFLPSDQMKKYDKLLQVQYAV